jgi:hypothetical protein
MANNMIGTPGQINRGSSLGEIIYNICLQADVNTIVEIGTWNGMGSTKCIYDAVSIKFGDYLVYTLECNEKFYNSCIENYKALPKLKNFKFILGTIIEPDENINPLSNFDEKFFNQYSRLIQSGWRNEDVENCKTHMEELTQKFQTITQDLYNSVNESETPESDINASDVEFEEVKPE